MGSTKIEWVKNSDGTPGKTWNVTTGLTVLCQCAILGYGKLQKRNKTVELDRDASSGLKRLHFGAHGERAPSVRRAGICLSAPSCRRGKDRPTIEARRANPSCQWRQG